MSNHQTETVTILGSTGSIGRTTLKLIDHHQRRYRVIALTAGSNWSLLACQAKAFRPELVAIRDPDACAPLKQALAGEPIEIACGADALIEAARRSSDLVMAGIVGMAGLPPTIEAIRRGARIGFANKECLVSCGDILLREARRAGAVLLPVDSEHNAVFQVFENSNRAMIDRIILTASGGPFRQCTLEEMATKTAAEAVQHPNWDMGAKISVDSATMVNKGLEVIEASYLFDMPGERIEILVHPESIVHSLVAYRDGSVLAQLGTPDMITPIACAMAWPARTAVPESGLDLSEIAVLRFEKPDPVRFPALRVAREALAAGSPAPLVLNAANEVAVAAFLDGRIGLTDIVAVSERVLERESLPVPDSIDDVLRLDAHVREQTCALVAA